MKSSFCIDLQRFMLIPTKFPLSHIKTHFLHFIAKKLGIYLVETNIYCTFATANKEQHNLIGVLVQLVRIHACHAWGHEFEPRTHRKRVLRFS